MAITKKYKRMFGHSAEAIQQKCSDIEITTEQEKTAREWITMIKNGDLEREEKNYDAFKEKIMVKILGYERESVEITAARIGKQPDFSVVIDGKNLLCVEAKGTKQGVFDRQSRGDAAYETPILQATLYKGMGWKEAFCTNYRDFVLIGESDRYHAVDFMDIDAGDGKVNKDKLRELIYIFSAKTLVGEGVSDIMISESFQEQKNITNKFYELFNDTRTLLIRSIIKNSQNKIPQTIAAEHAQMILNRLIFIFYANDRRLVDARDLFRDTIVKTLGEGDGLTSQSKSVWRYINDQLFVYFNEGTNEITAFNGGLFADRIPDNVWFADLDGTDRTDKDRERDRMFWSGDADISKIIKNSPDLNPIITNLLKMNKCDFSEELGPNLLGHIFEKSMSSLEKIGSSGDFMRKSTGAYYTLENVTSHICRNVILPYLSRGGGVPTSEKYSRIVVPICKRKRRCNIRKKTKKCQNTRPRLRIGCIPNQSS